MGENTDSIQASIDEGLRLYGRGEGEKAFDIFVQVLAQDPSNGRVRGYLSALSASLGRAIPDPIPVPAADKDETPSDDDSVPAEEDAADDVPATDASAEEPAEEAPSETPKPEPEAEAAADDTGDAPADEAVPAGADEEEPADADEAAEDPSAEDAVEEPSAEVSAGGTEAPAEDAPAVDPAVDDEHGEAATTRITGEELAALQDQAAQDAAEPAAKNDRSYSASVRIGVKRVAPAPTVEEKPSKVKSRRFGNYWDDDGDLADDVSADGAAAADPSLDTVVIDKAELKAAVAQAHPDAVADVAGSEEAAETHGADDDKGAHPIEQEAKDASHTAAELDDALEGADDGALAPADTVRLDPAEVAAAMRGVQVPDALSDTASDAAVEATSTESSPDASALADTAGEMADAANVAMAAMMVDEEPAPAAAPPTIEVTPLPAAEAAPDAPPPAEDPMDAAPTGVYEAPATQIEDDPWGDSDGRAVDLDSEHSQPSVFDMLLEENSQMASPAVDVSAAAAAEPVEEPNEPSEKNEPAPSGGLDDSGANNECDVLMEGARELFALGDFSGSLELVEKVLELDGGNLEARQYLERNEGTLLKMYESKLGDLEGRPRPMTTPDEVIWLNMHHRAGFVLSQVDGMLSYEEIADVSGLPRLETFRILADLKRNGVIGT